MKTTYPNLREKYLDAEALFKRYWELGKDRSVYMVAEWAGLEGMISANGNAPTPMGVWKAMWRWASLSENRKKAFEIASAHLEDMNWEKWEKEMIHIRIPSAWQHPTKSKREKFLRENGWL